MMSDYVRQLDAAELQRLCVIADQELSVPARVAHVALLFAASAAMIGITELAIFEPHLPVRTQLAFAFFALIGLCWIAYAVWTLARRRPLAAQHSVIAGRIGLACATTSAGGALILGFMAGSVPAFVTAGVFAALATFAATRLRVATRRLEALHQQRHKLETLIRS